MALLYIADGHRSYLIYVTSFFMEGNHLPIKGEKGASLASLYAFETIFLIPIK